MKKFLLSLLAFVLPLSLLAQEANEYFKPLKYRNIGPFRGGRSVTASGVINDPLTYYMGTTGGGLWKTEDAGQHWSNISDGFFETGSVGAVSVAPSNPNIVYCGMGEHAVRGVMTSYGDGIYKSTDAGKTWKKIGLENTQHIARIVIHPTNPDIVYVAAQGALFAPSAERGIYKTTDGGKNWKKVLYVNDLTGGIELSMHTNTPEVLYAAMWHHQRTPWKIISGGEGSGLYKSVDGGETWEKIEKGIPAEKGKMAIAVSQTNPNKVYALVESDSNKDLGGLFVSTNAGASWTRVSDDNRLTQRAWYYIEVFVDPTNENVVYVLSASALRSIDGGKTWEVLGGTHGDYHDLWINPTNSNNMVIADDGGAAISFNFAKSWSTQDIMPTSQLYRVAADNLYPYNLYAGQQDNTSLRIASLSLGRWSISEQDWTYAAGGESAFLAFDPDNPTYVMGGSYLGTIEVLDMESKGSTNIMAAPIQYLGRAARDMKYLYNWNAPIVRSVHYPNTFYHGAQLVLRTSDMGENWDEMSPDLTRNIDEKQGNGGGPYTNEAVGAENYGTLSYIMESPHEKGVMWTASDDGFVHITKDNGETWTNVTPKGLKECLVNAIEVSPHDKATTYIATTRYKFNDYTPGIYKTTDYGKTWKNISSNLPYGSFTRVVREDKDRKGLLYAGTEKGLFVSWNDGVSWESLQLNLPVTPITDLLVHKGDLIVATSGRSFWILDDIGVFSQYNQPKETLVYKPEDAVYGTWYSPLNGNNPSFNGMMPFEGVNPANGVVLYYHLEDAVKEDIKLTIKDADGNVVRTISSKRDANYTSYDGGPPPAPVLSKNKGLNRFVWDTRYPIIPGVPNVYIEASYRGHKVAPGTYTLELTVGDKVLTTQATILSNPLYPISKEQYTAYDVIMKDMEANVTEMHTMINTLKKIQEKASEVLTSNKKSLSEELAKEGKSFVDALKNWDEKMIQRMSKAYDDVENFPNKFSAEYLYLVNQTESSIPRVNQSSIDRKKELDAQWMQLKSEGEKLLKEQAPAFNKALWNAGIGAIPLQ